MDQTRGDQTAIDGDSYKLDGYIAAIVVGVAVLLLTIVALALLAS